MATRTKAPKGSRTTVPNEDSFLDDAPQLQPYAVEFVLEGTRGYLFNRYDVPANPDPGLKGQKQERPLGTMVTLDSDGHLAARSVQIWNAVVSAGKYRKNPRSARGSFSTVLKEAIEVEGLDPRHPDLITFMHPSDRPYDGWDFDYTARVKNSGAFAGYVTRVRPGIEPGWTLTGRVSVLLPEYVTVPQLHEAFAMAGRFGGIGDGRTGGLGFGRFLVQQFVREDTDF
jgi:hypothetical protein